MSVEKGQFEAGISIGLTSWQTIYRVIIPQAARVAIPGMVNSFANLFKSTSLAFTVGILDMTSAAKNEVNLTYRYLEGYLALLIVYWVILASVELLSATGVCPAAAKSFYKPCNCCHLPNNSK